MDEELTWWQKILVTIALAFSIIGMFTVLITIIETIDNKQDEKIQSLNPYYLANTQYISSKTKIIDISLFNGINWDDSSLGHFPSPMKWMIASYPSYKFQEIMTCDYHQARKFLYNCDRPDGYTYTPGSILQPLFNLPTDQ